MSETLHITIPIYANVEDDKLRRDLLDAAADAKARLAGALAEGYAIVSSVIGGNERVLMHVLVLEKREQTLSVSGGHNGYLARLVEKDGVWTQDMEAWKRGGD